MPFAAGLYFFVHHSEYVSRPPVILIHGAGGTHLNWPPQVRRIDEQRIFALDLPGHGKSEGRGRQFIFEYAASVIAFMDDLKLPSAVMAGHSMGSGIALSLALHHPERVLALVLLGSGPHLRVSPALLQAASDPSTFLSAVQMVTDYSYGPHADPRLKELGRERMALTRPSVFWGDLQACDSFDVSGQLGQIHCPTLILAGEADRMTPLKFSRVLQQQISGAQLQVLQGAGHMLMLEQPLALAALLGDFLNTVPDRLD